MSNRRFEHLRAGLLASLCAFGWCGVAVCQEPKTSAEQKEEPAKLPLSEDAVKVPDGSPAELFKVIDQALEAGGPGPLRGLKKGQKAEDANREIQDVMRKTLFTVIKASDKILASIDASDADKTLARTHKIRSLFQAARLDEKIYLPRLNEFVQQTIKDAPGSNPAALGTAYLIVRNHFDRPGDEAGVVMKLKDFAKTYPKNPIGEQLFMMYGNQLIEQNKLPEAKMVLQAGMAAYKADGARKSMLEGPLKKLELLGKPMELSGPTLQGSEFNIEALKGKVVLVDFWATWCGPCVGEIPGVKRVYEKLHDKGFEIVGVSLDNKREDLEKFVAERKIPWTQIMFSKEDDRGWSNPLARKYGINSIPAMFLIDQTGTVVQMNVRGEQMLEKAVRRLLNLPKEPLAN